MFDDAELNQLHIDVLKALSTSRFILNKIDWNEDLNLWTEVWNFKLALQTLHERISVLEKKKNENPIE